ncbi:M20 metallopeptidase family protein [Actinoplanes sp. CA-142083]|uniref:M20 metallopeptidase family protein n=1 Tax=Actinoplanes sp. CA-142083 TaxID=3239903 RepID=UPI003D946C95
MFTLDDGQRLADRLIDLRHALHREPELGLDTPLTQAKVLTALDGLPLEIKTGNALTSVTAVLRGGRPGPAVLLRGDMDALPLREESEIEYASRVPGRMHACGHDLHTAALAGAAHLLAGRRDELAGDVVFMFQPGEEGQGGARIMIDEGVLDAAGERVVAAYAMHVASAGFPRGVIATRAGAILSACDAATVTVTGKGGHGSMPHMAADPIPAMCEMVTALQTMVTRSIDIFDPAVISVGSIHAGSAGNVIPGSGQFNATIRSYSAATHKAIREGFVRVVRGIAAAHGVEAEVDYREQYPAGTNDTAEAAFALEVASGLAGAERAIEMPRPLSASDDFAFVLERVPGAYVNVAAVPPGLDPAAAAINHSPKAIFDDGAVPLGAVLLAELAGRRLASA